MNRRSVLGAAPVLLATLSLAACARPILNVERQNFATAGTFDQRAEQIRRAGAGLGWQIDPVRPGLMRATLNLRSHVAITEIAYDPQGVSIRYVDSRNLGYDCFNICKDDNGWLQTLARGICPELLP